MAAYDSITDSRVAFEDPDTNHFCIDTLEVAFPSIPKGRDFEIRMLLDRDNPATLKKFVRALPKRFQESREFWADYIDRLNQNFCRAYEVQHSQIRFAQISTDQCSLFHSDNVKVRLFQTLSGLGTEYLLDDNVDRRGIGSGCNSKIVRDFAKVQHACERDILLMRGDKWFAGRGLVHRSPPIQHLGARRLYLSLDAVEDLSEPRY